MVPAKLIKAARVRLLGVKALYMMPVDDKIEYMSHAQDMYDNSAMAGW